MAKALFIIGNGFDISLGLNTSYSSFYKYYKNLHTDNVAIKALRDSIEELTGNWSDFEKAFGEYTVNLRNTYEYDIVHDDVVKELNSFIFREQEIFINKNTKFPQRLRDDIYNPYRYLREERQFKDIIGNISETNVVTFNYTSIFEKLIGYDNNVIVMPNNNYLRSIEHIHNKLEDGLIFGVNDITQIANEIFHNNDNVVRELIKPNYNKNLGAWNDKEFETQIAEANIICIFGSSLGETDKIWWELICRRMIKDCRLIIFQWDGKVYSSFQTNYKLREETKVKDVFIERACGNMSDFEKKDIKDKIFVAYNTDMFKMLI